MVVEEETGGRSIKEEGIESQIELMRTKDNATANRVNNYRWTRISTAATRSQHQYTTTEHHTSKLPAALTSSNEIIMLTPRLWLGIDLKSMKGFGTARKGTSITDKARQKQRFEMLTLFASCEIWSVTLVWSGRHWWLGAFNNSQTL